MTLSRAPGRPMVATHVIGGKMSGARDSCISQCKKALEYRGGGSLGVKVGVSSCALNLAPNAEGGPNKSTSSLR